VSDEHADVVVVGAGLAGLTAAGMLGRSGRRVVLVDKGRSVGGRMATRRIDTAAGRAVLDHGAQFFTVRDDAFAAAVEQCVSIGLARTWCHGFGPSPDGHPRYVIEGGMNALAKHLASALPERVEVVVDARVDGVEAADGGLLVASSGRSWTATDVVLTPPVPQSLDLIGESVGLGAVDRVTLEAVRYAPCLALLVVFDEPVSLPGPGAVQVLPGVQAGHPFSFIADNRAKGLSTVSALTFHADDEASTRLWGATDEAVVRDLLAFARPFFAGAVPTVVQVKRWRYARPVSPLDERCLLVTAGDGSLVFAGDAFGGAKIEGAALSGAAAAAVLGG
jgi:hypothetical protein